MKRFVFILTIISLFTLGTYVSFAEEPKKYVLSLEDVTRLAIENNFDIQLAQYDAWIAKTGEGKTRSLYDTLLEVEVGYRDNQKKQTSTIFGTKEVDNDYNVGLKKKLPTGTTLDIDLTNNRNFTDSSFSTSPVTHESTLGVSITQELGKNFFGIADRGSVKKALLATQSAEYTSLDKIENSVALVQKAYWDLLRDKEIITLEKKIVEQAKELYDLNQEKAKNGLVEDPELFASEANYNERLNDLLIAKNNLLTQTNTLKLLLNIEDDSITIEPSSTFLIDDEKEVLANSLNLAFEHRLDYKAKLNEAKKRKIDVSINKSNLWPTINLEASFARNGLGDHFKQSIEKIGEEDNPNFFAGLTITFPLENREARAQLKEAKLEDAKVLLELKLLERIITIDAQDLVRNTNILKEVAQNNEVVANLQTKKLEAEQERYERGRSDTDTIIRFQSDALNARRKALISHNNYRKATVDLRNMEGALLALYWDKEL